MWEISNSLQLLGFARALVLGLILCLVYDIFRITRRVFHKTPVTIFFEDIFFAFFSAVVTFLFLLSITDGELRGYIFFGIAVGFLLSRLSLSRLIFKIGVFTLSKIKWLFSFLNALFYSGFDRIERNTVKFLKKSGKHLKKLLKRTGGLLYTKKNGNNDRSVAYEEEG